ncbi:hypothetical protein [Streptomyces scabiei]|uniref:hypothetical protein n=1 Tax=Streptomyces scabiei TaxID=1930 RepID=UPI0035ABEA42
MSDTGGEELSARERSELDQLRHRVTALEGTRSGRHHPFRSFGAFLLILLAAILSLLSVVAVWANSIVQDTDRYVATVGPLASNPDVQRAVTNRVTDAVLDRVDVDALVAQLTDAASQQGVPPKAADLLKNLDGPIESGLRQLVSSTVERVVSSSAFEKVWVQANRRAHAAVDEALTGESGGAVALKDNQVVVDVGPIVQQVKEKLVDAGFAPAAKIPDVKTDFVVFASKDIGEIKSYVRVLEILGGWLPVIALLVAAAGVYVAFNRRHAVIGAGLAVFLAMLVLGISLTVFRDIYLDRLPPGTSQAAAGPCTTPWSSSCGPGREPWALRPCSSPSRPSSPDRPDPPCWRARAAAGASARCATWPPRPGSARDRSAGSSIGSSTGSASPSC